MSKRAILYARTSGDDKKNATSSLDGQLDMCREYATGQGWPVVAELTEDERGVSGAAWDAPELNRALEMAQGGQFDVLVVREMDRLSRSLGKQMTFDDQFKRAGVVVVYVLEEYADSPEGRLSKHIRATVAEYEREKIRERTSRARNNVVKNGGVLLGNCGAPYGYRLVKENGRATLVIYEDEARIVRLIFEWYTVEGLSIRAIALRLTDMHVPTPSDKPGKPSLKKHEAREWGTSGVSHILNRETYAGTWWYGKCNGRTGTKNPKEQQIAVTVPATISVQTWAAAQERRKHNKAMAARNTRRDYLLRALLKCGQCGAGIVAQAIPTRKGRHVNLYYLCGCTNNRLMYSHDCHMPRFRADKVDAVVWEWLRDLLQNPETIREKAAAYQAQREQATRPLRDKLAVIDGLLKKEREQLELALDLYLQGGLMRDMLVDRQKRIETRIAALEIDRAELVQQIEAETLTDEQITNMEYLASRIGEGGMIASEDFTERRYVVETLKTRGELLLIDDCQYVKVSCYFGDTTLCVSNHNR